MNAWNKWTHLVEWMNETETQRHQTCWGSQLIWDKTGIKTWVLFTAHHLVWFKDSAKATLTLSPGPSHIPLSSRGACSLEITALKGILCRSPQEILTKVQSTILRDVGVHKEGTREHIFLKTPLPCISCVTLSKSLNLSESSLAAKQSNELTYP